MEEESKKGFKICSKCGRVLPLADFNKRKSSKDGLQYYCKDCQKAIKNEWRAKNPTYDAEWRAKNPTYNAEWRAKNPTYDAEYYQSNKEKKAAYNADYRDPQTHPMNWAKNMVAKYRQMDRDRGFGDKDTISVDYFIQHIANQPCAHCGVQGIGLIGCNRLDNTKPHTIDNVEPCCFKCNMKENIRDQIRRGIHVSCKHKKQSFSDFVKYM